MFGAMGTVTVRSVGLGLCLGVAVVSAGFVDRLLNLCLLGGGWICSSSKLTGCVILSVHNSVPLCTQSFKSPGVIRE